MWHIWLLTGTLLVSFDLKLYDLNQTTAFSHSLRYMTQTPTFGEAPKNSVPLYQACKYNKYCTVLEERIQSLQLVKYQRLVSGPCHQTTTHQGTLQWQYEMPQTASFLLVQASTMV